MYTFIYIYVFRLPFSWNICESPRNNMSRNKVYVNNRPIHPSVPPSRHGDSVVARVSVTLTLRPRDRHRSADAYCKPHCCRRWPADAHGSDDKRSDRGLLWIRQYLKQFQVSCQFLAPFNTLHRQNFKSPKTDRMQVVEYCNVPVHYSGTQ